MNPLEEGMASLDLRFACHCFVGAEAVLLAKLFEFRRIGGGSWLEFHGTSSNVKYYRVPDRFGAVVRCSEVLYRCSVYETTLL